MVRKILGSPPFTDPGRGGRRVLRSHKLCENGGLGEVTDLDPMVPSVQRRPLLGKNFGKSSLAPASWLSSSELSFPLLLQSKPPSGQVPQDVVKNLITKIHLISGVSHGFFDPKLGINHSTGAFWSVNHRDHPLIPIIGAIGSTSLSPFHIGEAFLHITHHCLGLGRAMGIGMGVEVLFLIAGGMSSFFFEEQAPRAKAVTIMAMVKFLIGEVSLFFVD